MALALTFTSSLGGCFRIVKPEIDVVSMRVAEQTPEGVVVDVELAAANRTKKDLKPHTMRYWLTLDGKRVFEGRRSPQATFSALGVQNFTAPIAIAAEDIPETGTAQYEFRAVITFLSPGPLAKVFFDLNLRNPRVVTQERGEIHFPTSERDS